MIRPNPGDRLMTATSFPLSSLPLLLVALFGFITFMGARAWRTGTLTRSEAALLFGFFAAGALWTWVCAELALSGTARSAEFLFWLPGLWLPYTIILILQPLRLMAFGRQALYKLMDEVPPAAIVALEGLRILGLGTLIKTFQGTFPVHFEVLTGIPDLLFGFSALAVLWLIARGKITWRGLVLWHLAGLFLLVPAGLFIQLGLPGPLQLFSSPPTSLALFEFPMILAPASAVPLFAFINVWSVLWLRRRRPENLLAPYARSTAAAMEKKAQA